MSQIRYRFPAYKIEKFIFQKIFQSTLFGNQIVWEIKISKIQYLLGGLNLTNCKIYTKSEHKN